MSSRPATGLQKLFFRLCTCLSWGSYSVHNKANGQEKARADLTTAFFNVCYYLSGAEASDVAWWQSPFNYAVCEVAPGIPFVLASLAGGRWLFDVSLN